MKHKATPKELERVRSFARDRGRFMRWEVCRSLGVSRPVASNALKTLRDAGELELIHLEHGRYNYQLTNLHDLYGADKQVLATVEGAIWTAIRGMRVFTARDVVARLITTTVSPDLKQVNAYCGQLVTGDVLRVLDKGSRTKDRRFKLIQNLGPLPPKLQRIPLIYDPNTGALLGLETLA
ncbi:MAG: hypothetical protein ACU0CO_10220 [Shimia sp.]